MNFSVLNIFPTSIYVGNMNNHIENKKKFYNVYDKFDFEENEYQNTVSENSGNPLIHLEPSLDFLFKEVIHHTKNYLHDVLMLKDIFNLSITKTWISRAQKPSHEIRWHIHSTSHVSFCYYLNTPKNSHVLQFKNVHQPNSLFLGLFAEHSLDSRNMFKEITNENCESLYIKPNEGDIVIFPSKLLHSTKFMNDSFDGERLAVVGDITLILKEEYLSYSMGYIDKKYWKTYQ